MGVSNKKGELSSALFDEMNTLAFRLAPPSYQADMLATIVIKLGWQWHPPKDEELSVVKGLNDGR